MKLRRTTSDLGAALDDMLAAGGRVHLWRENECVKYEPLSCGVGTVVSIRVQYRCSRCRKQMATVEDYTAANGQAVLLFVGKAFRRGFDGDAGPVLEGYTHHAFLMPDYGREPFCMCPTHGPLRIDAEKVHRDTQRSIELGKGQGRRTEEERTTRAISLPPLRSDWKAADLPERKAPGPPDLEVVRAFWERYGVTYGE